MYRTLSIASLALVVTLAITTANASELTAQNYGCVPDGDQVIPPQFPYPQMGAGRAVFTLSASKELSYSMYDCSGLTAIEAHIHGPAAPGAIGPILFTIPPGSSITWERTGVIGVLTDQQIRDLSCGLWYIDIHTTEFPLGQVRGQIRGFWGWEPGWPCLLATEATTWGKVKSLYRE
jgi:hypothetical protein